MKKDPKEKEALEIFKKWEKGLSIKGKSKEDLEDSFNEIFHTLHIKEIPANIAEKLIKKIASAQYPPRHLTQRFYNKHKILPMNKGLTLSEYTESWKNGILTTVIEIFKEFYPEDTSQDKEKDFVGKMPYKDYIAMRSYADSFPTVDFSKLPDMVCDDNTLKQIDKEIERLEKEIEEKKRGK